MYIAMDKAASCKSEEIPVKWADNGAQEITKDNVLTNIGNSSVEFFLNADIDYLLYSVVFVS